MSSDYKVSPFFSTHNFKVIRPCGKASGRVRKLSGRVRKASGRVGKASNWVRNMQGWITFKLFLGQERKNLIFDPLDGFLNLKHLNFVLGPLNGANTLPAPVLFTTTSRSIFFKLTLILQLNYNFKLFFILSHPFKLFGKIIILNINCWLCLFIDFFYFLMLDLIYFSLLLHWRIR